METDVHEVQHQHCVTYLSHECQQAVIFGILVVPLAKDIHKVCQALVDEQCRVEAEQGLGRAAVDAHHTAMLVHSQQQAALVELGAGVGLCHLQRASEQQVQAQL